MTIHQLSSQLHSLAVGGFLNGEKFSQRELENYIAKSFRPETQLKLGNELAMEIALPDGRWIFSISRFGQGADGFDYCIPDTREQEARLVERLLA